MVCFGERLNARRFQGPWREGLGPTAKVRLQPGAHRLQLRHETANQSDFRCLRFSVRWLPNGKSRAPLFWFFNKRRTAASSELQL